jgi:integrase
LRVVVRRAIKGLRKGRTDAREDEKVMPVADGHFDAVKPHVSGQVWTMIELQCLTGMRTAEACVMRTGAITMSGGAWECRPAEHKTEHVEKDRLIHIGPRAQEVLRPWFSPELEAYLFQPGESKSERAVKLRAARKTLVQPSQRDRRKKRPLRREFESETAKAAPGHSSVVPPQIYAEQDMEAARRAMERLG